MIGKPFITWNDMFEIMWETGEKPSEILKYVRILDPQRVIEILKLRLVEKLI